MIYAQWTSTKNVAMTNQIAAAVWDQQTSAHTVTGSFGVFVKKLLTVAKFLGLK